MNREFVLTKWFDSSWKDMRLSDIELHELQTELLRDPAIGSVMKGCGGFRKIRAAPDGRGKSGGVRVIYLDVPEYEMLYLTLAYAKNEKDSLTEAEKKELKEIATNIKNNLRKNKLR
jgi:Uncharacterized protein conserved in bacteria